VVYRLPALWHGEWTFEIENDHGGTIEYQFVVSARNRQGAHAQLCFAQYHGDDAYYAQNGLYLVGLPMPVTIVLTDAQGPIRGADVTATVTHPLKDPVTLRLRDDGGDYDGTADDGVYSGTYTPTTEASFSGDSYPENDPPDLRGSYQVTAEIQGTDNFARSFERIKRGSFQVYIGAQGYGQDTDYDNMPDRYEDLHKCLDKNVPDAAGDADGDGIPNGDEYSIGTAPCCIDTDGGGETDNSELSFGSNPFDHLDDAVLTPVIAGVMDRVTDDLTGIQFLKPGQNVIRFSPERGYHQVNIYRTDDLADPFVLVASVDPAVCRGIHEDVGLVNGETYYYYIEAEDAAGRTSVPSHIFSGTPRADPVPPNGMLIINNGDPTTDTTSVDLAIVASPDVTEIKISNDFDLTGASWQAFSASVTGHSLGTPSHGEGVMVFVVLRDAAGNETRIFDGITYLDPGGSGRITGMVLVPLDADNSGCLMPMSGPGRYEYRTRPSGEFRMAVLPGDYVLRILMRGYEPVEFAAPITVAAGGVVDLGVIELVPLDSDGDLLPDVDELRHHGSSPKEADTDGDGHDDGVEVRVTRTDPTNAASVLTLMGIIRSTPPDPGGPEIIWQSVEGVTYEISATDDISSPVWTIHDTVPGAPGQTVTRYSDPSSEGIDTRVYRVGVAEGQ
jgi:hypothetical protein